MAMLERIKKKQLEGFMEFVQNMETTGASKRQQILTAGILEDPVFMSWVLKNIKGLSDFLTLPSDQLLQVIATQQQMLSFLAKAIFPLPAEKIDEFANGLPKFNAQLRDELTYLKDVSPSESTGAAYYLIKAVRKLQQEELIQGFGWKLPPMDLFYPRTFSDGEVEIFFDSGILAAKGMMEKNRRTGSWTHYYDNGKVLAKGEYIDGLKAGNWEFFFADGKTRSQGQYFDDERGGPWKEWDRNGVLTETQYRDGFRIEEKD